MTKPLPTPALVVHRRYSQLARLHCFHLEYFSDHTLRYLSKQKMERYICVITISKQRYRQYRSPIEAGYCRETYSERSPVQVDMFPVLNCQYNVPFAILKASQSLKACATEKLVTRGSD